MKRFNALIATTLLAAVIPLCAGDSAAPYREWRIGDSLSAADRQTFIEWTRPGARPAARAAVCDAAGSRPLPRLETLPGDALSDADKQALAGWVLSQPAVVDRLGASRTRVLRMGADMPKGPGGEFRRATLFIRNYDAGLTHAVYVNLQTAAIDIVDLTSLVQPNSEEMAEALGLIGNDPALASLLSDPTLFVTGGFFNRAEDPADPCYRDICLHIEIMTERRKGFARRIVVNLTRQQIANRNFQATTDPDHPSPMTKQGGK